MNFKLQLCDKHCLNGYPSIKKTCVNKFEHLALIMLNYLNKSKFLLLHILFWIGVWFFYIYFFSYNSKNTSYVSWFANFLLPITIVSSYTVVYFLIPKYLLVKKYVEFALYSFYTLIFSSYFILLGIFVSFIFLSDLEVKDMPPMSRNFIFIIILVYLIVGTISFMSLLRHNFRAISKNKELENKILETQLQLKDQELQYLKKQIHPHFLFNTLNTIYGFALKQSNQTPEIILKLSSLLDYILYQVNKPQVSLKEEISHIKAYIDLEKIRFQDSLKVSFISDEISEDIQIAPMLLIPFIENSFKHGNLIDGFLYIDIVITFINDTLNFHAKNTFLPAKFAQKEKGIGLVNLKKRLDILYKNNYHLDIVQDNKWYTVNLSISNLKATTNG